ncbi:MAG TPA: zinc-dependent metalloprotease family protein [Candidatus Polarisedimenticolia bacterium]|nr:zinc-dependent metalloprotease family protein [Candidatus Polarisedimenticolia bacterium]
MSQRCIGSILRSLPYGIAAILMLIAGPAATIRAAEPSSGTLSGSNDEATWTGTFYAPNPAACATSSDPLCDHFRLTIDGGSIRRVLIAISPEAGFEDDDYDLFVYDDQGVLVASQADGDGNESVVIENTSSTFYEVRVQPFLITPGSTYRGVAMKTREQAVDADGADCLEAVPSDAGVPGVTDAGQSIELSVMLLLDGTDATVAGQLMARAAESYAPLGINLVLKKTKAVSYTSSVSEDLIAAAKATVGGVPPRGIDLVGVFTTKEMQAIAGGATVVGQADCIGGVRFDEHSFFVVSDIRSIEDPQTGTTGTLNALGLNPNVDATAEVMAHEMGHLMGAHHHYANCVEGNLSSAGPNDLSPCTLMFNAVNFASLNFGVLSGAVVRGHAVGYAAP